MKLLHLRVNDYKNLRDCKIEFTQPFLLNAVIGRNGSGKSNLIEAMLHILIGFYFKQSPPFDFRFDFEAQERKVTLEGEDRGLSVRVDGESKSLDYFAERLRGGPAQVFYLELTFVYYSGACQRVRRLIKRYERDFQRPTRKPETDNYRPLFVESGNEQSDIILLALFAHRT
jgi:energy-coupling factor transporter ATP-binding protein EcfA2